MNSYLDEQRKTCIKFGADYFPCDDYMMVGISRDFDPTNYPINGLRHPPDGRLDGMVHMVKREIF